MSLLTAHRILISSGIAMCIVYTVREVLSFSSSHALGDLVRAFLAVLVTIGLSLYLRSIRSYSCKPLPVKKAEKKDAF